MTRVWLSTRRFTCLVVLDSRGYVTRTAPILHRFVGRHFDALVGYARMVGGLRIERL